MINAAGRRGKRKKVNIWVTSNNQDELNALKGGNLCQRLITIIVFLSLPKPLKNIKLAVKMFNR